MNNKTFYYIVSLVLFIVGITIIGVHVNNYRKVELYQNLVGTPSSFDQDGNILITGRINAQSNGHVLGLSKIPDNDGNIILRPSDGKNVTVNSDTIVNGKLTTNKICFGNTDNCIDKPPANAAPLRAQPSLSAPKAPITCLSAPDSVNGTRLQMDECNNNTSQQFKYMSSTKQIQNVATGKCVDVLGGNNNNGAPIGIWECGDNNENQQFIFNPATSAFHWVKNSGRCIDRPHGLTTKGTQIQLYDCHGGDPQRWW